MTHPTSKDKICDPACCTAGFLISSSDYLLKNHSDTIYQNAESRKKFNEGTFHGFDFDSRRYFERTKRFRRTLEVRTLKKSLIICHKISEFILTFSKKPEELIL